MDSVVALGHVDLDCGMGMDSNDDQSDETSFRRVPCCNNEFVSVEIDDQFDQKTSTESANFINAPSLLLYEIPVKVVENSNSKNVHYIPPPPDVDLTILHQVFLV